MPSGEAGDAGGTRQVQGAVVKAKPERWLNIAACGILLLGVAAIIQSVDDWIDSRNAYTRIQQLNNELRCRYEANQEVEELQAELNNELALGLSAYAQGNEQELQDHSAQIRVVYVHMQNALEERGDAAKVCGERYDSPLDTGE